MERAAALVQTAWLPVLVCALLAISAIHLVPRQLHSECEMTWMYSWPQYQKLNLSLALQTSFPQYSLHLYRETRLKVAPNLDATPLHLQGLPVLFIPGNAGSHKQGPVYNSITPPPHSLTLSHVSLLQLAPLPQLLYRCTVMSSLTTAILISSQSTSTRSTPASLEESSRDKHVSVCPPLLRWSG